MKKTCYLLPLLGTLLLTACTEEESTFSQQPTWKVANASWRDGRAATRAVTDNVPTTELPQELDVKQVGSDPEITFTIKQEHSHDHDGYLSYHTQTTANYDPEASFIAYNKDWPTETVPESYCGFFDYMSSDETEFDADNKHLMFTLKHRSALVRLFFGISEKYNVTRQVELTSLLLNNIPWSTDGTQAAITPEHPWVVPTTQDLTAWYYVSPRAITALTLEVNYAVYSRNELGIDTKPTRQVEAVIPLNNLLDSEGTKLTQIEAGNYYDLHLLIDPDYLYTLSDHDEPTNFDLIIH